MKIESSKQFLPGNVEVRFLASNVLYLSYAHTEKVIDKYYQACEKVFLKIEREKMEILQIY